MVKTGEPAQEGPRPKARPGTHAKRAQHASHVVVVVLIPIYVFTDLRLYRVGKFLKKIGAFYKKKCVVFVYFTCCVLVRFEGVCDFNRHKKSSQISLQ